METAFSEKRKEELAEIFLRAFAKRKRLTVLVSDRDWSTRLEEYADAYLYLGFHWLSDELVDIIPHLPIAEDEAYRFASLIALGILEREKVRLAEVSDLVA